MDGRRKQENNNEEVTSRLQTSSHASKEKVAESLTLEQEAASGSLQLVGKRSIEFNKHAMHEGDLKRMRDSHELNKGHEQGLLSAFTCSFLDNPGLPDLWFGPQEGDMRFRGNGTKARTPNKPGKPRVSRKRYMRDSPKPVTSLESCLRAQLHFDEDKRVSRSLFYEEGRAPGLGEVEALESGTSTYGTIGFRKYFGKPAMHLPPLARRHSRQKLPNPSASRALLFSFGVGVGVMHMKNVNNAEIEKLTSRLKETEQLVQELQARAAAFAYESVQEGNMEELEAQLEAELELMQLQSAEVDVGDVGDIGDFGEVVHDQLIPTGLPGASDLDDDRNESGNGGGDGKNWAVSPRELDKRLRMLLESRQEERISQLEEELENAENQLQHREEELRLWKERVRLLTQITSSPSGERDTYITHNKKQVLELDLKATTAAYEYLEDHLEDQSPTNDICDEFLKSVGIRPFDNSDAPPAEASSYSASELEESWQEFSGKRESPLSKHYGLGGGSINEQVLPSPVVQQEIKETASSWALNFIRHAGASTPLEDIRSNRLVNTPRTRQRSTASILDKIRYWENLSKGSTKSEAASSPEPGYTPQTEQVSPLGRFSYSDVSSCDNSFVSDDEEHHHGDVLIKRIVEKSRKGSTLLKDVQLMLAALDCESG